MKNSKICLRKICFRDKVKDKCRISYYMIQISKANIILKCKKSAYFITNHEAAVSLFELIGKAS